MHGPDFSIRAFGVDGDNGLGGGEILCRRRNIACQRRPATLPPSAQNEPLPEAPPIDIFGFLQPTEPAVPWLNEDTGSIVTCRRKKGEGLAQLGDTACALCGMQFFVSCWHASC